LLLTHSLGAETFLLLCVAVPPVVSTPTEEPQKPFSAPLERDPYSQGPSDMSAGSGGATTATGSSTATSVEETDKKL